MSYKEQNWCSSGCSVIVEPGEKEVLLEWRCPTAYAAEVTEYMIGCGGRYIDECPETIDIELAFERLSQTPGGRYTYHLNPSKWTVHPFQVAVQLIATNKGDQPQELWGTIKGRTFPITQAPAMQIPAPTPPISAPTPEPTISVGLESDIYKEKVMTPDQLSNSHDDLPKMVPTALGIVGDKENPTSYADGDVAALHVDNRGRLLVSMDGITEDAEKQLIRLSALEVELNNDLAEKSAEIALEQQKVANKQIRKMHKLGNKRRRIDSVSEEALAKEDKHTKTVVSAYRYEFLSTLIRWAAVAGAAITITYFLA